MFLIGNLKIYLVDDEPNYTKLLLIYPPILIALVIILSIFGTNISTEDNVKIIDIQSLVFVDVSNGLNDVYWDYNNINVDEILSNDGLDIITVKENRFPRELGRSTIFKEYIMSDYIGTDILGLDPWGTHYEYHSSPNKKYAMLLSKGKNRKTGKIEVGNFGKIKGFDRDDIYAVFKLNNRLNKDNPHIIEILDTYYP